VPTDAIRDPCGDQDGSGAAYRVPLGVLMMRRGLELSASLKRACAGCTRPSSLVNSNLLPFGNDAAVSGYQCRFPGLVDMDLVNSADSERRYLPELAVDWAQRAGQVADGDDRADGRGEHRAHQEHLG
jgi:hypothetical protein